MARKFRMDKTAFAASSFSEADNHVKYWKDKSYNERMAAAFHLIIHAYGISPHTRLDKTVFAKRKR